MGGSLPPINKSALPPLLRTLPALKNEVSKDEKMAVNPLDMSMLPQISREGGFLFIRHFTAHQRF